MKSPLIQNETDYDFHTIKRIVNYVFKYFDLDGEGVMVKVKFHRGWYGYSGRCYYHAHVSRPVFDRRTGNYKVIETRVPPGIKSLLVCRIGKPDVYPIESHVYQRVDSPGTWMLNDWREALVSICAHEAMHLRQFRFGKKDTPGRFNETDTEWAAYRLHGDWVADEALREMRKVRAAAKPKPPKQPPKPPKPEPVLSSVKTKPAMLCGFCGVEPATAWIRVDHHRPCGLVARVQICQACAAKVVAIIRHHPEATVANAPK